MIISVGGPYANSLVLSPALRRSLLYQRAQMTGRKPRKMLEQIESLLKALVMVGVRIRELGRKMIRDQLLACAVAHNEYSNCVSKPSKLLASL